MAADRSHASLNSGKKVRGEAGAPRVIPAIGVVEIKLGVVTALIGVPVFLAMIFRERRMLEGSPS